MKKPEELPAAVPTEVTLAPNGLPEKIEDWTDDQLVDSYAYHLEAPYSKDTQDWLMELETEMMRREAANAQHEDTVEYPYLHKATDQEALALQLPPRNLPEYATAGQYHRTGVGNESEFVPGVRLEVRNTILGAIAIYRDPITGEVYRSSHQ